MATTAASVEGHVEAGLASPDVTFADASAASSIPAGRAVEPIHEGLAFAEIHSQLYLSQKADDSSVDILGCLPPESMLSREEALDALRVLGILFDELKSCDPFRIFRVRDKQLYDSLKDSTPAETEAMQAVANYLLLPKELSKALDQHLAVLELKKEYTEAMASYNLAIATEEKPRLYDLLEKNEHTKPLVAAALKALYTDELNHITAILCDVVENDYEGFRDAYSFFAEPQSYQPYDGARTMPLAFRDGLTGEPLSEFGYTPSQKRVNAYAAACVLMDRPLPLEWLDRGHLARYQEEHFINDTPLRMAACLGKIDVLEQLESHGCAIVEGEVIHPKKKVYPALIEAARMGQVEVLKFAYKRKPALFVTPGGPCEIVETLMDKAAHDNRKNVLRWFLDEVGMAKHIRKIDGTTVHDPRSYGGEDGGWIAALVAHHNDLELLKELHSLGSVLRFSITTSAVRNNNPEMLKWAVEQGCTWNDETVEFALRNGLWDLFRLNYNNGKMSSHDHLAAACEGFKGDVAMLEAYVKEVGGQLTDSPVYRLVRVAAKRGYLATLIWAKEVLLPTLKDYKGNPLRESFEPFGGGLELAVEGNQGVVLRWLVKVLEDSKKPVSGALDAAVAVVRRGFDPESIALLEPLCLRYFDEKRALKAAERHDSSPSVWGDAIEMLCLPALRWLHRVGAPYEAWHLSDDVLGVMRTKGAESIPLLECLVNECGWPALSRWPEDLKYFRRTRMCEEAAKSGSVKLLEYLLERGCEASPTVLERAVRADRVPLARWLHSRFPDWELPDDLVRGGDGEGEGWVKERRAALAKAKEEEAGGKA
jgi:hypothetical protein